MPRLPIDYTNTVIYKIVCNDLSITDIYVGHTTDFAVRKYQHRLNSTNVKGKEYETKLYTTIRDNGGFSNWSMVEVEKYPCNDSYEARAKEREWFETLNARLNTIFPQRNYREHYIDNRERIIARVHSYADTHKPVIAERGKSYRASHKEEIKERRAKTFICECGKETTFDHKSRHLLTLFHQQFVNTTETL